MNALRGTLIVALSASFIATISAANKYGNCMSTTDAIYTLPDTNFTVLNKFLNNDPEFAALLTAGCPADRDEGVVCPDKPAIGSGIAQLDPNTFIGLTDRGPNQDCEALFEADPVKYAAAKGKSGKGFPLRKFAPTLTTFQTDSETNKIVIRKNVPLKGSDGKPITGISNTPADDTPYGTDCAGEPIKYDPSGLDPEDMAKIPGTDYVAIVDEYSPSVVIVNYLTGVVAARHVPVSLGDALSDARYPIVNDIPDIYTSRRKNRGFEGIVVDAEGKYVIAILQSPMLGDDPDSTSNNAIIRCAYFKLKVKGGDDDNDKKGVPSLKYKKTFVFEASSPAAYENPKNKPKDMKYSGAHHYAKNKFIALERAKGQVKLFLIDFSLATNIDKTKFSDNLDLEKKTNGIYTAEQAGVIPADKTLVWDSAPVVGGSIDFTGNAKQEAFVIDMVDNSKVWMMNDNDFGLDVSGNVELRQVSLGRSVTGATVCEMPAHPKAPVIDVNPSKAIKLVNSQTYRISNVPGAGSAENFDVSDVNKRAYVANDDTGAIDMYDVSVSPAAPLSSYSIGEDFKPTSASVCKTRPVIAAAFANVDEATPGRIDILSSKDLTELQVIRKSACILPDSVKWSDDCKFLVVACEGEGADVPGGVLVADFGGPEDGEMFRGAKVATFKKYDPIADVLKMNGVRLVESNVPSVDLEPEFVAFKGKNAFLVLQEANAIAVVDLYEAKITELKPIGFIDRSLPGFALDASDKDDGINIRNYPGLYGIPQPDTIVSYTAADGKTYLVFSNEGDAKDSEEVRGADVIDPKELNRKVAPELKPLIEDETKLGRIKISSVDGYNAATNTQEKLFHFGSRSFSIMAMDGSIVFDSGEWFARIQEKLFPAIFNANSFDDEDLSASQADLMDNRYVFTILFSLIICISAKADHNDRCFPLCEDLHHLNSFLLFLTNY